MEYVLFYYNDKFFRSNCHVCFLGKKPISTIFTLMNNIIYYTLPGQFITVIIYTELIFNFLMCENNWIYVYFDTLLIYCEFVIDGRKMF